MLYGTTFVAGGYRPAIAKQGPKWTQVVYMDGASVRVCRLRGTQRFEPLMGNKPYTLAKLAREFLRSRNSLGCKTHVSKTARKILKEAIS